MGTSEAAAFRRLYSDHFSAILGYTLRRADSPDDAADLVAEVFLVAWRRRAQLPVEEEIRPWLFGVARRVLANQRRGEQRRRHLGRRLRLELREHLSVHDPTEELVEVGAVRAALSTLPAADREVLELAVWEQIPPREIAIVLGLSAQVVRTRLSRARSRVRAVLESGPAGHDPGAGGHDCGVRTVSVPLEGEA